MRRVSALVLVVMMAVAGCGSSSKAASTVANSAAAGAGPVSSAAGGALPSAGTSTTDTSCPTSNTRSFAKTRFVSDLGGAAFLIRRYLYQPYTQGSFSKGHPGRTAALAKAAATAVTVVHLLKNASLNAKGNPTLCKAVAAPLSGLTSTVSGLTGPLHSGAGLGALGGLGGSVTGLLGKSKTAGLPVTEQAPTGS